MAMTITQAKDALQNEINPKATAAEVEKAFIKVVNNNNNIKSGDDISKITKAALLLTHSDKIKDENAEELTKKLTNIMSYVGGKNLQIAKKCVNENLSQQNTAPTQTETGPKTEGNYKKLNKLLNIIELGDKLGLTSKRATKYLNNTLSDHEKISTTDLNDEIKAQVIAVQKKINTALQSKLKQLPQSDYNQLLQNELKLLVGLLDNGKMAKTQEYNDLYDSTQKLKNIGEKFDEIIINPKINDAGKALAQELKEGWKDGKLETTLKELGKLDEDLKTEYPSGQNLKTKAPSARLEFIRDYSGPNKENKGPSNRGPN